MLIKLYVTVSLYRISNIFYRHLCHLVASNVARFVMDKWTFFPILIRNCLDVISDPCKDKDCYTATSPANCVDSSNTCECGTDYNFDTNNENCLGKSTVNSQHGQVCLGKSMG